MLTAVERILFALAALASAFLALRAIGRLVGILRRGRGRPNWRLVPRRLVGVLVKTIALLPVFRARPLTSLFHAFVVWGFTYYLFVNVGDVLQGFLPGLVFLGRGRLGDLYRLGGDILSVAVLVGMLALAGRRFVLRAPALRVRESTLLHPKARRGIQRDSAIVAGFIVLHVGGRFLGESFHLAGAGRDGWQPFASAVSGWWAGWAPTALEFARHAAWWLALGLILAFIPYFPYSKHIHLFFAPLNFLLKPERRSIGELEPLDFEDQSVDQFGVARLEDLSYAGLMDAYACIMCNRCQDACPAYTTGKVLSPAALEINKRYFLNQEGSRLAAGENSSQTLLEFAIPPEAVWACTACGACSDICPVGNEPMRDILEIRRFLVLTENVFPEQLQVAYRGMERTANPWNIAPEKRLEWAEGLAVPTVAQNPKAELLWWVGCAPATDPRAQKTARAFARLLAAAGVDYAVLGPEERCTGDAARRSGNEYLFSEMASANVETLNRVAPRRIVTTCPHCLHTLKNEYPAFGGNYAIVHHSELLEELIAAGRLPLAAEQRPEAVTFHDPCYLGRQNGVVEAPRAVLQAAGERPLEMTRSRARSFCCGAGGAQMWKEEEHGQERVNAARLREARATGASTLAVGCPFCMVMLADASRDAGEPLQVRDLAEILAERLPDGARAPTSPTSGLDAGRADGLLA
ncbi:MAG: [Fe-S]-binding protein [Chloroflexi bacterium RBG_13_68_17]|nr:MAG: [Fe-S]-binding protein [Chloroflexi bacterium RBG_13_68_17]